MKGNGTFFSSLAAFEAWWVAELGTNRVGRRRNLLWSG